MKLYSTAFRFIFLFSTAARCLGQGTIQVTFDGAPHIPDGASISVQGYYESGLQFSPLSPQISFTRVGNGYLGDAQNGTAFLRAALTQSLTFGFTNGSVFSLGSVDLAEYSTVVPNAVTVHFVGYRQDGSTVTTDLTTDGIIDSTGPLADFQTFTFGPEFSGLTRVEIPTYGWSLDNLVLSVPEPSSGALTLVAGLLLAGVRFVRPNPKNGGGKR